MFRSLNLKNLNFFISKFSTSTTLIETRYTHLPSHQHIPNNLKSIFSIESANKNELLKIKKRNNINKYQLHSLDVGSSQVQGR